jgi:hypothetical protein
VIALPRQGRPHAAQRARQRYACFDHAGGDAPGVRLPRQLGLSPRASARRSSSSSSCSRRRTAPLTDDERFYAEQNARVAVSAEAYYRSMFGHASRPGTSATATWRRRSRPSSTTSSAGRRHRQGRGLGPQLPLGDARATQMGDQASSTSASSSASATARRRPHRPQPPTPAPSTAASTWGGPRRAQARAPVLPGSYVVPLPQGQACERFMLSLERETRHGAPRATASSERAIGVILPAPAPNASPTTSTPSSLDQFDHVLHSTPPPPSPPRARAPAGSAPSPPGDLPHRPCDPKKKPGHQREADARVGLTRDMTTGSVSVMGVVKLPPPCRATWRLPVAGPVPVYVSSTTRTS